MSSDRTRIFLIALLTCGVACAAEAPAEKPAPPAAAKTATADAGQVDAVVRQFMEQHRIPGLSLAVVHEGRLALVKGYGLANVEHQVPASPETVYQIQSITKSFTAAGILLLAEDGKLGVDDKLSVHLDGTPDSWRDITVRHLLSHTSGIKDFINEPTASLRLDVSEQEVFQATVPRPLNFPPGERYAYSNTNYHLLAMIIRKLTGKPYGEFLRERIFEPLGMRDTRVINLAEIIPHRAAGYLVDKGVWRNGEFIAPSILGYGGGGLRSTVLDMVQWDAALDTDRLLKQASRDQMWTPAKLNNGQLTSYGFGWNVRQLRGHRCVSHGGGHVTGFSTVISRFVDERLTVIAFSNCGRVPVAKLAERIAGLYLPSLARSEPPPPDAPDPPTYRVRYQPQWKIQLDGVADEPAWSQANVERRFCFPWKREPAPATEFRALCDDASLYFTFRVEDPDIFVLEKLRDKEDVVFEDRAELYFVRDERMQDYYCLEVDSRGRAFDYRGSYYRRLDPSWNWPGLETKASSIERGYVVEGRLPLASLEALGFPRLRPGAKIRCGLYRAEFSHDRSGRPVVPQETIHNRGRKLDVPPPIEEWISWVDPKTPEPDFHVPSSLGWLEVVTQ